MEEAKYLPMIVFKQLAIPAIYCSVNRLQIADLISVRVLAKMARQNLAEPLTELVRKEKMKLCNRKDRNASNQRSEGEYWGACGSSDRCGGFRGRYSEQLNKSREGLRKNSGREGVT